MVYTNAGSQLTHSWVAGRTLMEERKLLTLNEAELIQTADDWRTQIKPD